MHVRDLAVVLGEARQLEVVRGEERECTRALDEMARDRPGECEAIEGGGAASDLVHEHEALLGRVV
ncbi:MAG: hypothetical protein MUF56_09345, partial [Solirubrobacteraceae bacterium]|nr:hypothetical protein [Solirubrobacteraceae bacterium]